MFIMACILLENIKYKICGVLSMLKKIIYPILFLLFLTSCEINPLLGVGSTVDTLAPQVVSVIPTDNSYIRDDFDFIATFYDNLLVTEAKLEIERNGEKIFEKSEKIEKF